MSQLTRQPQDTPYAHNQTGSEGRWEILDGIIYDMNSAPSRQHQVVSDRLFALIHNQLGQSPSKVFAAPFDVRLTPLEPNSDNESFTVVQPDIVVVCDQSKLADRGYLGTPDLVIEILSPATASKDLMVKRDLYERHGVREYWLVHPTYHFFMIYTLRDKVYPKATIFSVTDYLFSSAIPSLKIDIAAIFPVSQNSSNP